MRETALRERPQVLGLRSLVDRSGKALDLARKDYYPDFDVKFSYAQRDNAPDGMRRDDMLSLTVAINLRGFTRLEFYPWPGWPWSRRSPLIASIASIF